jgi:hypothetical protein
VNTNGLLNQPYDLVLDAAGDIYIANWGNGKVVEVPANGDTAYALQPGSPNGTAVQTNLPGVAVDALGNVYFDDYLNNRVIEINQTQQTLTFVTPTDMGVADRTDNPHSASLLNAGNQLLTLSSDFAFTPSPSSFSSDSTTTCSSSKVLSPGATCLVAVDFEPFAAGPLTGYATVTDDSLNNANASQQITLNGTGKGFQATIALSENPGTTVSYGTAVTVTATLSGNNGVPTGNITYTVDNGTAQSAPLNNGVATFTLPGTLNAGPHSVLVNYAGDNNYTASQQTGFTLTVTAAATSTTLTASPLSAAYGSPITLTATVDNTSANPSAPITTGGVTFLDGQTVLGTGNLNA